MNNRSRFDGSRTSIKALTEFSVFIGRENPIKNVRQESVIMARYNLPHKYTGSMTLVGPTRMDYKKNLGLVKYATEELNKIAKQA